ncbi:MAG: hypothetical protein ABIQ17_05625 [Candidatus Limnocylindrales bacterium]
MSRAATPSDLDVELRLAAIHVRLGSLLLARAELESLASRDVLPADGLADLAELRWRSGDIERAGEAAAAHLAAGGNRPIARVVLAESDAAAGRTVEAGNHVQTLRDLPAAELETLFAGMPQRAPWRMPSPGHGIEEPGAREPTDEAEPADEAPARGPRESTRPRSPDARATFGPEPLIPVAQDLLARAIDDLDTGDPARRSRGLDRLAVTLRLDPRRAPEVVDLLQRRREPAAHLIRGDGLRIMGRALDAEAAYLAAAAALETSDAEAL